MTVHEITALAIAHVRSAYASAVRDHPADATYPAPVVPGPETIDDRSPRVAMTLARWAAYPDPAELPPGWQLVEPWTGETGIQQLALSPAGVLFRDAPGRRIAWTCPAGTTHRRYWRSGHHPNRPALVACEHQPEPVELRA